MANLLNHLIGDLMIAGVFALIAVALWFVYWSLGGGAWRQHQERRQMRELERSADEALERAREWDLIRAQELDGWLRAGGLPTPLSRVYPTYPEYTWEWGRLQRWGYQMDHDPVLLDDGQLLVTYSVAIVEEPSLTVLHG